MYLPAHFAEPRLEELHRLIEAHPLGALVRRSGDGLDADHVPFELDRNAGPHGVLRAHVARSNPVWREADGVADGLPVLVIFRGSQGYISPSWYPSKALTHRHVPTWNYEVVHVHGRLKVMDDERFVRGLLARLTRHHEAAEARPWKMGDAPPDFIAGMLQAIVGIEVEVTRLEGKRKLGQNREPGDFAGAVQSLYERGQDDLASAMARTRVSPQSDKD